MSNVPVLIVITADGCGACKQLKRQWSGIKKWMEDNNIDVEVRNHNTFLQQGKSTIKFDEDGPDFSKDIRWFPTLILIPRRYYKPEGNLANAYVYNGKYENGTLKQDIRYRSIQKWITETIDKPAFKSANMPKLNINGTNKTDKTDNEPLLRIIKTNNSPNNHHNGYCQSIRRIVNRHPK